MVFEDLPEMQSLSAHRRHSRKIRYLGSRPFHGVGVRSWSRRSGTSLNPHSPSTPPKKLPAAAPLNLPVGEEQSLLIVEF